jgi:hypothetical protein
MESGEPERPLEVERAIEVERPMDRELPAATGEQTATNADLAGANADLVGANADQTRATATIVEEPLAFEPFHTIDYFASQGIKLGADELPNDRLGRQLKSFTDWLKVMRRLPQKDRETAPDIVAEHAIQSIAAHSIEGKEVVTETMAEVLTKQGMREKAAEVYHKLSLLNPGKSAYFAAKIEQLKNLI